MSYDCLISAFETSLHFKYPHSLSRKYHQNSSCKCHGSLVSTPLYAEGSLHNIPHDTAIDVQGLIQVDHILATNLSSDGFANSDAHVNSDGYGTVNDQIFPSNLVPELFGSALTDVPKLKK